jgi:hypothetical protein
VPKTHNVKQGDHLPNIAKQHGSDNWRTIYDHPLNAIFRSNRTNPNVLLPGDVIWIPDKPIKTVDCKVDSRHCFELTIPTVMLRIVLRDNEDRPLRHTSYTLTVKDASREGHTDDDGLLQQSIPATLESVLLKVGDMTWELLIGHLDPVDDAGVPVVTGIQARLRNLGLYAGKIDGVLGPKTLAAIKKFQGTYLNRGNADGKLDDDTKRAVLQHHGC